MSKQKNYYRGIFVAVTLEALDRLARDKIRSSDRMILIAIMSERYIEHPTRKFKCSMSLIRRRSGCGYNTIAGAIRRLEEKGIVEVDHSGHSRRPNRYKLNADYLGFLV